MMTERDFLRWEAITRDTIDVKRCYIDIAGGIVEGVLLSQIIYYYLPDKEGRPKKLFERDGRKWIVRERKDWWRECRVSIKQFDRAIQELEKKSFVTTDVFQVNGTTAKAISVNFAVIIKALSTLELDDDDPEPIDEPERVKPEIPFGHFPKEGVKPEMPKGDFPTARNYPKGNTGNAEREVPSSKNIKKEYTEESKEEGATAHAAAPNPPEGNSQHAKAEKKRVAALTDQAFLEELQANPAYAHIDVCREYHKMLAKLKLPQYRGKLPTRKRFLNWLNYIDPPIALSAAPPSPEQSTKSESRAVDEQPTNRLRDEEKQMYADNIRLMLEQGYEMSHVRSIFNALSSDLFAELLKLATDGRPIKQAEPQPPPISSTQTQEVHDAGREGTARRFSA